MPLVLDPESYSSAALEALLASLQEDLAGTEEMFRAPIGRVRDPASIALAEELVRSARTLVELPAATDRAVLAARANLAYAVMLAAVDLVKSHSDVPKVPAPRSRIAAGPPPGT